MRHPYRAVALGLLGVAAGAVTAQGALAGAPPAARPRPAATTAAAPAAALLPAATVVARTSAPDTGWPALDAAVARIPGYASAEPTTWTVAPGHWGSTLLPAGTVTVSPDVPAERLDAVVRHEWAHVLAARAYGGDVPRMVRELDAAFGGTGTTGVERAADCGARLLGATWTHYTPCADARWRAAAARLLAGQTLG